MECKNWYASYPSNYNMSEAELIKNINELTLFIRSPGYAHLYLNNKDKNLITNTSFYSSSKLPKKHNHIQIEFDRIKMILAIIRI